MPERLCRPVLLLSMKALVCLCLTVFLNLHPTPKQDTKAREHKRLVHFNKFFFSMVFHRAKRTSIQEGVSSDTRFPVSESNFGKGDWSLIIYGQEGCLWRCQLVQNTQTPNFATNIFIWSLFGMKLGSTLFQVSNQWPSGHFVNQALWLYGVGFAQSALIIQEYHGRLQHRIIYELICSRNGS